MLNNRNLVDRYLKMLDASRHFRSTQDNLLYTAHSLDPSINTITEAIQLAEKLKQEEPHA